ncbi:CBBY-like protein isoform X2 [Rhodamnia argentea]|uniref:CBBY-like protein isoform X2 n=1 Tax=Rhodamnia argentea TaxID=178133 RepID=A0ABM3HXE5_9MYRT|nr:CBBY-like protein isoform X2 [Rhodamnia argentea]
MRSLSTVRMESLSPVSPHHFCCSNAPAGATGRRKSKFRLPPPPKNPRLLRTFPSSLSLPLFIYSNFFRKNSRACDFIALSSLSGQDPPQELALLLEVEGVLVDAYRKANRQAFNLAFRKLGLDCANWTQPVYLDLVRKSAAGEERMLILYFNRIGWPTSLPTSEKSSFVKSVLREKKNAMDELMMSKDLPLRPGIQESVAEKLGQERISKVKIIGPAEVEQSLYGQLVLGKGVSSGLDEVLAKEVAKAASAEKQRIAKEVASMLKVSVEIDTTSSESLEKIVVALRAGAEFAGVPVCRCILVAGSQSGVAAAERIGMPCVVVRSSFTSRAEFPSAKAVMDGFGGADLTISKLTGRNWS